MAECIQVKILFFSVLRNITGANELTRDLDRNDAPTVGNLLEILYQEFPRLKEWDSQILIAADLQYVNRDHVLEDGQEVAIMPPVQGG